MDLATFKKKYNYNNATTSIKQYLDIKFAHFNCLLLYRMGDFYELFYEDAVIASRVLGIALTKRHKNSDNEIPMCGVPYHALENYLNRLIEDGFKIAICDQLETPEEAKASRGYKAVVNRDVVRIITPGTITEESLIKSNVPNYLASLVTNKKTVAICYVDLGIADSNVIEVPISELLNILALLKPKELIISEEFRGDELINIITNKIETRITFQVDSFFALNKCRKIILNFYNIPSTKAIAELSDIQISSIGSTLEYITLTQKKLAPSLNLPTIVSYQNFMHIDLATRTSLEITQNLSGKKAGSLLSSIDYTITKGAGRELFKFLSQPLTDIEKINHRLNLTEFFYNNESLVKSIRKELSNIHDLERILSKINSRRAIPKDLLNIKQTLIQALEIKNYFTNQFGLNIPTMIEKIVIDLSGDEEILSLIDDSIENDPPTFLNEGGYIRTNYHDKVMQLRSMIDNGRSHIDQLKTTYQKETEIDNLRIQHNNILGLFIEINSRYASKIIDPKFIHKQTTTTSVRYTTAQLQQLETEMVNAKSLIVNLEIEIFNQICSQIQEKSEALKALSVSLNHIDLFSSLAHCAHENNYCKPIIKDDISFNVTGGRHPVIEQALITNSKSFTPNECDFIDEKRIWLITGPNMAGKSTFLRQNALITILAQIGSYVPATAAEIGIVDKIFSRIGSADDLIKGESTFMVEMLETSAILAQASSRSLIILDEVGRGTSTYDGVAIAWSVLEYIHNKIRCRCLFATHYFELTNLSDSLTALKNYTIEIQENNNMILFMHNIIEGAADKSYGVHVAELAGLPVEVIKRAKNILTKFESSSKIRLLKELKVSDNNFNLF